MMADLIRSDWSENCFSPERPDALTIRSSRLIRFKERFWKDLRQIGASGKTLGIGRKKKRCSSFVAFCKHAAALGRSPDQPGGTFHIYVPVAFLRSLFQDSKGCYPSNFWLDPANTFLVHRSILHTYK